MGRRLIALLLGAVAAVSLTGCTSSSGARVSSTPTPTPSATADLVDAAPVCTSGTDATRALKLGAFLPLSGGLAYLGPAAAGGVDLAVSDMNGAGGVLGQPACITLTDSGEAAQPAVSIANLKQQLASQVSAIVGPESSGVVANVLPTVGGAKTVLFSNAATEGASSKWFFRNSSPNGLEATRLGDQIVADGRTRVAFLTFDDPYGLDLRDGIEKVVTSRGAAVVYGAHGGNQEFASTETDLGSAVTSALGAKPDAVVLITFGQVVPLVEALAAAGWDMKHTYFVDGNLNDYTADLPANTLSGAQGTARGASPAPRLKSLVTEAYRVNGGTAPITSFAYAAEAYDAATLIALAAEKAKSAASDDIRKTLPAVSGTTAGAACQSFKDCKTLIDAGQEIAYQGYAGTGAFNDRREVSSGYISLYQYVGNAPSKFVNSSKESG